MYKSKEDIKSKMATEQQKLFQELFGANEQIGAPSVKEPGAVDPPSPKKYQFTYWQVKKVSELLEKKIGKKFWINLTKDEQETEKANPSDNEYYRISYCQYNGFPLINIIRYFPNPANRVKGKSYATINLKTMKTTMNSLNKIEFDDDELKVLQKSFES